MSTIHEVASVTSKGQITLPKSIRQLLGVAVGEKIAFDLCGETLVVSKARAQDAHEDPAIGAFLRLLENDIAAGRIAALPDGMAQGMLASLAQPLDLDEEIVGEVAL